MNLMREKLRSERGESLVETLTAVVIIALASAALASMIASAAKLNITARENDHELYEAISQLEEGLEEGEEGMVTVTLNNEETRKVNFPVNYAQDDYGLLTAFEYTGGGT